MYILLDEYTGSPANVRGVFASVEHADGAINPNYEEINPVLPGSSFGTIQQWTDGKNIVISLIELEVNKVY